MKKLFSFIFAACMAITAFAAEEVSTCPAGTLADGKVTHELECCTIVQEQGESTTALKSVSPWQAPAKSIMTITPKAGVSIEQFSVNTKNTTLATYLGKAELTNATKTSTKNTIVTFAVTDPTQPVVMKFVSTTIKFAELTITYTASAVTPDPEQPADTTVTPTPEPEPEPEPEPKPTGEIYTVAGSPKALFGTEWDPANKANVMEFLEDGTYKWEKKDVEMSATTVQFKVVKGSAWGTEYPSSNYELKIAKSGKYTITITFNPDGNKVGATATLQQEVDVIPSIAIAGDMNGWNTSANTFTMAEDKKTASLALNLEAKDYGFKMIIGGSWTNDGQVITRENNSAVYTGANVNDNGTLSADVAGEYTFTWTYATSTLVVTYPALTPDPEQPGDTTVTPEPEQPTVTYTVAGSSEAAFGTTWSCDNAANDMTLQADGTYKWEKTGLELLAGSLDFKVCKDHSWDVAYPGSDYKLTIPATGIYTVTITFNPTTEEVNATATKTGDVVIIPTVAMHGNFAGASSWNDTENFTIASDEKTATLVMNLEARSDYEFGMRIGGKGDWTANGAAFARESNSAVIEKGTGNITLIADVAGEYTFTWTYATNTLTITFPAKSTVGFEEIEAAENPVKFIENGKLYIIREGNIYDATGARVK